MNPVDLVLSLVENSMIGGILAEVYAFNQAIAYSPGLHINRTTDIKIEPDHCYPRLPPRDEGKEKGFKLYYNEEMLNKQKNVEVVNYPRN